MACRRVALRPLALAASSFLILTAGPCGGDKVTAPEAKVVAVRLTVVPTNPRVGESTDISAVGVDAGGVTVQGVSCTYVSGSPAVLAVTQQGPDAIGVGLTPGTAVVTATCGGKQGSMTLTVRPSVVTFIVNKLGPGSGSVFLNPAGGTYDKGTTVTVTATAIAGSVFGGWGGTCVDAGLNSTCTRTLNANETATATFLLNETFAGWSVPSTFMGNVTTSIGCGYAVSVAATFQMIVSSNVDGTLGGTASGTQVMYIAVTYAPPYTTCNTDPGTRSISGPVSGSNSAVTGAASSSGGGTKLTFNGVRSGNTMTGSLTMVSTATDGSREWVFTKVISPYTLTKQ